MPLANRVLKFAPMGLAPAFRNPHPIAQSRNTSFPPDSVRRFRYDDRVSIAQSRNTSFPLYRAALKACGVEFQSLKREKPLSHNGERNKNGALSAVSIAQTRKASFPLLLLSLLMTA